MADATSKPATTSITASDANVICPRCNLRLHKHSLLKPHLAQHNAPFPCKCKHLRCGAKFRNKKRLIAHCRKEHPTKLNDVKNHVCPVKHCDKMFLSVGAQKRHLAHHAGPPPKVCRTSECGKRFWTSNDRLCHEYRKHGDGWTGLNPVERMAAVERGDLTKWFEKHARGLGRIDTEAETRS